MIGVETGGFPYWWILPLVMMGLCFFMMRRKRGSICGVCSSRKSSRPMGFPESGTGIVDERHALGERAKEEYEEKKGQ